MPKTAIDYSNCMFYRLVCRDPTVTECYVGSTTDEINRRRKHKSVCHNEKAKGYNYYVYRFIRDHGGFENWQMLVHEKLAVADKTAAALREYFWCVHYNATLNSNVPGRTHAESVAAYYAEHVEEIKITGAAWRAANKEKHDCPCGGKHITAGKAKHNKSLRHVAYLAAL